MTQDTQIWTAVHTDVHTVHTVIATRNLDGDQTRSESDNTDGLGAKVRDAGTETDIPTEFTPGIFEKESQGSTAFGTYSSSGELANKCGQRAAFETGLLGTMNWFALVPEGK